MCRGAGKVQRSILALIEARPDEAFVVIDVAESIYACAKPTRAQIDAVSRALKTMRLPGEWRSGYVQGGDRRRWLYRDVDSVARRMRRLETFEIEVKSVKQPVLVQATSGVWFQLAELEPIEFTFPHDLSEIEIVLTGLPPSGEIPHTGSAVGEIPPERQDKGNA